MVNSELAIKRGSLVKGNVVEIGRHCRFMLSMLNWNPIETNTHSYRLKYLDMHLVKAAKAYEH